MTKYFYYLIFFLFIISFFSCNTNDNKKNNSVKTHTPDNDTVKVEIHRYEKALFAVNLKDLKNELNKLKPEYGFFLGNKPNDTMDLLQIKNYLYDPLINELHKECAENFPDMSYFEKQLSKAFFNMKLFFSDKKSPCVYTYVSGLDYENPVNYADSVLIIALDMYLGKDCKYYKMMEQPIYQRKRFRKDFILVDCMKEIAKSLTNNGNKNKNFLDYIIYEGKVLYFLDVTLRDTPDSLKIYYSPSQMEWCVNNESNMWAFIIDKKVLYSTDPSIIKKLCKDGPFTSVFSKESPPRIGNWLGWQIVRSFMENNKNVTIKELFANKDSQGILTMSKYKPKK